MLRICVILAMTAALALTACNDDDGGTNPGNGNGNENLIVEVKAGKWEVTATLGGEPLTPGPVLFLLCDGTANLSLLTAGFGVNCTTTRSGNNFSSVCSGTRDEAGCTYSVTGSGNGSLAGSKDSFAFNGSFTQVPQEGDGCEGSQTVPFSVVGFWKEDCDNSGAPGLPLESLGDVLFGDDPFGNVKE